MTTATESQPTATADTSPSPTPSTPAAESPSLPDAGDFNFGGVDFDGDLDGVTIPKPEAPPAPAPVEEAPKPAPTVTEAAPVAPPQPKPEAQAPPAQQEQQQPATPTADEIVATPEGFLQAYEQGRDRMIDAFATQTFALSDQEKEALATDPESVIPSLMGKVLFHAIGSAQRLMMTQLPYMIANHTQATTVQGKAQEQFFEKFPELNDAKYLPEIQRVADFYKQQYPKMPLAERIEAIGTWARTHFKVQAAAPAAPAAAPAVKPQSQVVQRQVFQPAAAAGGSVRGAPVAADDDPFAGAFQDYTE